MKNYLISEAIGDIAGSARLHLLLHLSRHRWPSHDQILGFKGLRRLHQTRHFPWWRCRHPRCHRRPHGLCLLQKDARCPRIPSPEETSRLDG